jgi:hypothetical protein
LFLPFPGYPCDSPLSLPPLHPAPGPMKTHLLGIKSDRRRASGRAQARLPNFQGLSFPLRTRMRGNSDCGRAGRSHFLAPFRPSWLAGSSALAAACSLPNPSGGVGWLPLAGSTTCLEVFAPRAWKGGSLGRGKMRPSRAVRFILARWLLFAAPLQHVRTGERARSARSSPHADFLPGRRLQPQPWPFLAPDLGIQHEACECLGHRSAQAFAAGR